MHFIIEVRNVRSFVRSFVRSLSFVRSFVLRRFVAFTTFAFVGSLARWFVGAFACFVDALSLVVGPARHFVWCCCWLHCCLLLSLVGWLVCSSDCSGLCSLLFSSFAVVRFVCLVFSVWLRCALTSHLLDVDNDHRGRRMGVLFPRTMTLLFRSRGVQCGAAVCEAQRKGLPQTWGHHEDV